MSSQQPPDDGPLSFAVPPGFEEDLDESDFAAMHEESDPAGAALVHDDLVEFEPGPMAFAAKELTWEDCVEVAASDSPDYRHLGEAFSDEVFSFDARALALLAKVNHFEQGLEDWGDDLVIFGLRGCRLASGEAHTAGFVDTVPLAEDKLNHTEHHCVLGVWNKQTGQIACFTANTVPSWHYLAPAIKARTDNPKASGGCSTLMTGLYRYAVGPHPSSAKYHLDALRTQESAYVVWRPAPGKDTVSYDVYDSVDGPSCFGHNIHPSWGTEAKAARHIYHGSAGCQTFPGGGSPGNANRNYGVWLEFRRAIGLPDVGSTANAGKRFSYMLLTGREARMVTQGDPWRLERIRHGSRGDKVRAAQGALGLKQTGVADGTLVRKLVVRFWGDKTGSSDPVLGPWEAAVLGLSVGDSGVA